MSRITMPQPKDFQPQGPFVMRMESMHVDKQSWGREPPVIITLSFACDMATADHIVDLLRDNTFVAVTMESVKEQHIPAGGIDELARRFM